MRCLAPLFLGLLWSRTSLQGVRKVKWLVLWSQESGKKREKKEKGTERQKDKETERKRKGEKEGERGERERNGERKVMREGGREWTQEEQWEWDIFFKGTFPLTYVPIIASWHFHCFWIMHQIMNPSVGPPIKLEPSGSNPFPEAYQLIVRSQSLNLRRLVHIQGRSMSKCVSHLASLLVLKLIILSKPIFLLRQHSG